MTTRINGELVGTTIDICVGVANYSHTEVEDKNENWDDHWEMRNGEYVIHKGNQHHVYLLNKSH